MSDALPRREVRPAEMEVFYRLLAHFPDLAQVERELDGKAHQVAELEREKAELEERIRAMTQPRLTVGNYEAGRTVQQGAAPYSTLRPRTIAEARSLHKDGVITRPELRRMIGYGPTDEELDAEALNSQELKPPRHVIARMVWGTIWRLAPVLAGPGLWPRPDPLVKLWFWGLLAVILVITGLAGGLWRRLGLAGSLWRTGLAALVVGVGWQLGLHALVASIILGAVICISDITARVVLEDERA